jgi:uncharacterized RDD family membrane protein YckC
MRFEVQRADFWKRISAFLFDIIMIGIVIVGSAYLLSVVFNYDYYADIASEVEAEYVEKYGINPDISADEYEALSEEQKAKYIACDEARQKDERLIVAYDIMMNLALLCTSLSVLIGYLIMEFAVPLFFGNGQTLGKKAFGLAVMHSNGVRLRGQAHFVRSVIGKGVIETMVPVYIVMMIIFGNLGIVGTVVLLLLLGLEIFTLASTRYRSAIHDLISDTVVVDYSSQLIFESVDELMAYKTRIHAEEASRAEY